MKRRRTRGSKRSVRERSEVSQTRRQPERNPLAILILGLAIIGGTAHRGIQTARKNRLLADEGISYLAATGHKGELREIRTGETYPCNTWVKGADWKRLIQIEDRFCFGRIASDLARMDKHPPLYFWLLHVWVMMTGVRVWSGPLLNMLLALVATIALFRLAHRVTNDAVNASSVSFIWAMSPTVIMVSHQARQYDLLALGAILFVWQIVGLLDSEARVRSAHLVALATLTAIGLLTFYHFPILVVGCVLLLTMRLAKGHRRRMFLSFASIVVGGVVFLILNPGFQHSVRIGIARTPLFLSSELAPRLRALADRYTSFFIDSVIFGDAISARLQYAVLLVTGLMVLTILFFHVRRRLTTKRLEPRVVDVVLLALWLGGTNIFLYLACISPRHAMEARHVSMVYPFIAFIPALFIQCLPRGRLVLTGVLCLFFLATGTHSVLRRNPASTSPGAFAAPAESVIIDNTKALYLPSALIHVPAEANLLVASRRRLLDDPAMWRDRLGAYNVYIAFLFRPKDRSYQRVVDLLGQEYDLSLVSMGLAGNHGLMIRAVRKTPR